MERIKIGAVIPTRNDNYGGNLNERAIYCLNSMINTMDRVVLVDWNSPTHALLYDIQDKLQLKGNLTHIVIPPIVASQLTNFNPHAQKCCEVLCRNIGIRRLIKDMDWIISTNIDIICTKRTDLEKKINDLEKNTFYTLSRRDTNWEQIKKFHGGELNYRDWENLRNYLIENSEERHLEEKTVQGDDYSLVNCTGDFQLAPSHIWNTIRGFEEELIYPLYADTNVQKKVVMHGFGLKAIFTPPMFHINHGTKGWGGGGYAEGINKISNDINRAVLKQELTQNPETWGFSDIDIEYEIL